LNKTRAHVASAWVAEGEVGKAAELDQAVLRDCTTGGDCAKARYYAHTTLATVKLREGEAKAALWHMRQGVADSELGFGPRHAETALALLGLAVVLRQTGDLEAARSELDRANQISQQATLRRADRVRLARMRAVLGLDLGDYAQARSVLQTLLGQSNTARERALLWRLMATAELALGHAAAGREAAAQAIASGAAAGPGAESLFAHQAHARALALEGAWTQASDEMQAVVGGLHAAGFAAHSMEVMRARRLLAEIELREGHLERALALLRTLAEEQRRVQAGQEAEFAHTLDLLGCAEREAGQHASAARWHREAAQLLAKKLPADHPFRHRNTLYQEAAALNLSPSAETTAAFAQDASRYAGRFPGDSSWRRLIERSLSARECAGVAGVACGLVL
jgi:tetratricopeptide (TPR) repeat protein